MQTQTQEHNFEKLIDKSVAAVGIPAPEFIIEKTTYKKRGDKPKAYLLKRADGRKAWIMAKWLRPDGTLTAAGVKSLAAPLPSDEEQAAAKEKARAAAEAADNAFYSIPAAVWENEKAIGFDIKVYSESTDRLICRKRIFIQRAKIQTDKDGGMSIPGWLVKSKIGEIKSACGERRFGDYADLSGWDAALRWWH